MGGNERYNPEGRQPFRVLLPLAAPPKTKGEGRLQRR